MGRGGNRVPRSWLNRAHNVFCPTTIDAGLRATKRVVTRTALADVLAEVRNAEIAFDQAATGMALLTFDAQYLRVNHALTEFLGRPERDLLQTTCRAVTHADDVDAWERAVERMIAGCEPTARIAQRFIRRDGTVAWGMLSLSLVRSDLGEPLCTYAQVVDITDQRAAHERLQLIASIVESSGDGILSNELDGTIVTWNEAAERLYGYTPAEILGHSVFDIVGPERAKEAHRLLERVGHGESVLNQLTSGQRKDASALHVAVTMSPIRDDRGEVVRSSSIVRDVTEQKRRTEEMDEAITRLSAMLRVARSAEARSGRLLSEATRHLRDRIAAIRSCAETLVIGSQLAQPVRDQLLVGVAREAARVSGLVDRLSQMNRLEHGEVLLSDRYDLSEICQNEVERSRSLVPTVDIVSIIDPGVIMEGDPLAARPSIENLLENARRHALRRIVVTLRTVDREVEVRVEDDGPGVPEAMVERAFEPFIALDGQGGAGLGLALARAFARAHSGGLNYEANAFVLRLPHSR